MMRAAWPSRLWFGTMLLLASLSNLPFAIQLVLLALLLMVHLRLDGGAQRLRRLAGLLPWFVLPILLLHALFTPGEWLLAGVPLSHEGIARGTWLALHFCNIFLAAMLLGCCLVPAEWMGLLSRVPGALPVVKMLLLMRGRIGGMIAMLAQQWRIMGRMRCLPALLIAAVRQCLDESRSVARAMWLRWPPGFPAPDDGLVRIGAIGREDVVLILGGIAACMLLLL